MLHGIMDASSVALSEINVLGIFAVSTHEIDTYPGKWKHSESQEDKTLDLTSLKLFSSYLHKIATPIVRLLVIFNAPSLFF